MSAIPVPPSRRRGTWRAWLAIFGLAIASFVAVAAPVFMINPFGHQTPTKLAVSYALRRATPVATILVVVAIVWLAVRIWPRARWYKRIFLPVPLALAVFVAWFSWQNHFEWMFRPIPKPGFVAAEQADFVKGPDMVFGVASNGDAAAYPVRQIAYHHVVNDTVGGVPLVVTY